MYSIPIILEMTRETVAQWKPAQTVRQRGGIKENLNAEKHIQYWHTGSNEDWEMAEIALEKGKIRHGLFFLHLAMEKLIKAHVFRVTGDLPPKIHNLVKLMESAAIPVNQNQGRLLQILNSYCMEGRYPDEMVLPPTPQRTMEIVQQAQEMRTWLLSLL